MEFMERGHQSRGNNHLNPEAFPTTGDLCSLSTVAEYEDCGNF